LKPSSADFSISRLGLAQAREVLRADDRDAARDDLGGSGSTSLPAFIDSASVVSAPTSVDVR
jgi:hypothetical protein